MVWILFCYHGSGINRVLILPLPPPTTPRVSSLQPKVIKFRASWHELALRTGEDDLQPTNWARASDAKRLSWASHGIHISSEGYLLHPVTKACIFVITKMANGRLNCRSMYLESILVESFCPAVFCTYYSRNTLDFGLLNHGFSGEQWTPNFSRNVFSIP